MNMNDSIKLETDPRYMAAAAKLAELKAKLASAEKRYSELLSAPKGGDNRSAIDNKASALLAGDELETDPRLRTVTERELAAADTDRRVLWRAIEMQAKIVRAVATETSVAICRKLEPRYGELVRAVAGTAKAHAIACDELSDFLEVLTNRDIQFLSVFHPMQFRRVGSLREPNSHVSQYLAEAEKYGFLSVKGKS